MRELTKAERKAVAGGKTNEMARETNLNRTKSASKIHNKHVQAIMA